MLDVYTSMYLTENLVIKKLGFKMIQLLARTYTLKPHTKISWLREEPSLNDNKRFLSAGANFCITEV